MRLNRVHVTFDDDGGFALADGGFGAVEGEEQATLFEERRLRRVDVFCRFVGAERASAEADDSAALIADRDHHTIAKAVVNAPGFSADQ